MVANISVAGPVLTGNVGERMDRKAGPHINSDIVRISRRIRGRKGCVPKGCLVPVASHASRVITGDQLCAIDGDDKVVELSSPVQ